MIYLGRLKSWIKARIKRITATTSKTAIAVLSAVIIAFVVSVSVFKSVRFFSWEHPGILIVVLAVAGEVICDWNRKKTLKERLKKFFGILLVAGLLLEIAEAVKSDEKASAAMQYAANSSSNSVEVLKQVGVLNKEAADARVTAGEANERAANTESNNLVLQSKVLELEARAADRQISEKQINDFIQYLGNSPKGVVFTAVRHPDLETVKYAAQVCSMLTNAGFTIASKMNYSEDVSIFNDGSDIGILVDRLDDMPPYTVALIFAFQRARLNPTTFTNHIDRAYTPNEAHPGSNEVWILIGEKP
jgi:hypothetical protein